MKNRNTFWTCCGFIWKLPRPRSFESWSDDFSCTYTNRWL